MFRRWRLSGKQLHLKDCKRHRLSIMTHTITLTADDYIAFQLYDASTNPIKRKKRRRGYFRLIVIFAGASIISLIKENDFFFYYFLTVTLISICFGNVYLGWRHKRHYTKFVENAYSGKDNELVRIEIGPDKIFISDKTGESNLNITAIVQSSETAKHFFIKISTGPTLIIPKTEPTLNEDISEMIKSHNILYVPALDWRWK